MTTLYHDKLLYDEPLRRSASFEAALNQEIN